MRLLRRASACCPLGTVRFPGGLVKFFIVIVCVSAVGGVVGAFFLGVWIVVYMIRA